MSRNSYNLSHKPNLTFADIINYLSYDDLKRLFYDAIANSKLSFLQELLRSNSNIDWVKFCKKNKSDIIKLVTNNYNEDIAKCLIIKRYRYIRYYY